MIEKEQIKKAIIMGSILDTICNALILFMFYTGAFADVLPTWSKPIMHSILVGIYIYLTLSNYAKYKEEAEQNNTLYAENKTQKKRKH